MCHVQFAIEMYLCIHCSFTQLAMIWSSDCCSIIHFTYFSLFISPFFFPFHPFHLYICFHSVMHFSCSDLHSIFHFNDFFFFCHNLKFTSYSTQGRSQSLFYIARLAYRTLHNSRRQLTMYFWYFLCMILAHFQVFCLSLYYGWWTLEEITLFTSQASGRVAFSANLRRNATPSLHLPPRWTKARQRWHLHFCSSFYCGLWTLLLHCICLPGGQRLDKGAHVQKTADLRPKHNKVVNQPAKQPPHGWTALNCPFWSRMNLAWI